MSRLTLYNEDNFAEEMDYVGETPDENGAIVGRFPDQTQQLLAPFILSSKEGKLHATASAKQFRVIGLTAEGKFELVPDL